MSHGGLYTSPTPLLCDKFIILFGEPFTICHNHLQSKHLYTHLGCRNRHSSKYHWTNALETVAYLIWNICTKCNRHSARMYLLHMCNTSDLVMLCHDCKIYQPLHLALHITEITLVALVSILFHGTGR